MMNCLFITGISGFIGRHLLQELDIKRYDCVFCLGRDEQLLGELTRSHSNLHPLPGDLYAAKTYAPYLARCNTVLHLAAVTGKADPQMYFDINVKGTQFLLEQCKQAEIKNFLYVSTIAVKYPDKTHYYYAQSKEAGELAVKQSGLNYTIVRPTIVIGREATIWQSLSKLAKPPIMVMFGDGKTKIQPIYIEDVVNCLLAILDKQPFTNEIIELGGEEMLMFEDFLKQIHYLYHGQEPRFVVHVPLKLLVGVLLLLERFFYSAMPINAGQLAAFKHEGTIQPSHLYRQQVPHMKSIPEMLNLVVQ